MELIEKFCCIVVWPLSFIMPINALPEFALLLVFGFVYFLCEFVLTVFNVFAVYTGLSHFLVGLTLMVWGSDCLELINMIICVKNDQVEMGLTSVMSCQIICLLIIIPVAALGRMMERDQAEIQVLQSHHSREMVVLPPLLTCVVSLAIFMFVGMELGRVTSTLLIILYFCYVGYSIIAFSEDD